MNFFLAFEVLLVEVLPLHKGKLSVAAPACIMCINPPNRMRGHDEARRREASVQSSRPEVGRSIIMTAATLTS